jgi:hypothetical protein
MMFSRRSAPGQRADQQSSEFRGNSSQGETRRNPTEKISGRDTVTYGVRAIHVQQCVRKELCGRGTELNSPAGLNLMAGQGKGL